MSTLESEQTLLPPERLLRHQLSTRREPLAAGPKPHGNDSAALHEALQAAVDGEVRFDPGTRGLYSLDASNYLHVPLGVVLPKSGADVRATLTICRSHGTPVVSRAGGTALAGQSANQGVVLDFSKYMNRLLELDSAARTARVEPGLICDDLARAAASYGLTWGPKPATHDHCCFGGMLGNNCGGMRAQYAGIAVHNVESMRVALYDGLELELGWMNDAELKERSAAPGREGRLFDELKRFRDRHEDRIRGMPQLPRRVSGYNLDWLLPDERGRFNLARSLVGSEGTCVTMLEAKVRLVDDYRERLVVALGYEDVFSAGDHVPAVLEFMPLAVEGMDHLLYQHVVDKHLPQERYLNALPEGKAWLLIELGSNDERELEQRAAQLMRRLQSSVTPSYSMKLIRGRSEQEHLWKVREAGLGATAFVPGQRDAWPGFEDSAVRPEQLGSYLRDLRELFRRYDYEPSLYGHFGMGLVHCRVQFDLQSSAGVSHYRAFMNDAAELVAGKYRGSLSGEHGDGQARGELLVKMFGPELVQAFREFKAIWDPEGGMNPGRVVDARPLDADLRLGPNYHPLQPPTHFRFPDDGGSMAHATLRCVGVGKCRRLSGTGDDDTMCPSFMVTREEKHSTRGRAHLLWEMLRGQGTPITGGWQDEHVKEALDLCLSCKGCKGDCPVNVDVATYKAEFLSHYYEEKRRPRVAYAFGYIDRWARLASRAPGLVNVLTQTPVLSSVAKWLAGATQARPIPPFAPETFRRQFGRRRPKPATGERVLLWPDTFNNHFFPDTAMAAVDVLEHAGFEVQIPRQVLCCGRPLYDYGFLSEAKLYLERVLAALEPEIRAGTPLVVLEPSCCSVFRDELRSLLPDHELARKLREQTFLLSELLVARKIKTPRLRREGVAQGHCHHKAIMRFSAEREVFDGAEMKVELLRSGCCGLAGSFGFEADKYEISRACGERALLPAVREQPSDALILADGFSCRTQIAQLTERRALHLAEALKLAIDHGPDGPDRGECPEAAITLRREQRLARAKKRTLLGLSLLSLGVAGAWALRRRSR
ncbi:MAG TPA: FAD-binding and (Fe-S)-binding domain-containing protein [Polyangiaceae bacterium]|nr:FAD-binding and (Fe-S)-binding domain-containing protein [Polyangiaceae bacterium]